VIAGTLIFALLACIGYMLKDWWDHWDQDDPRRMLMAQVFASVPGGRIFKQGSYKAQRAKTDQIS